jgi:hypothetical protein
MSVQLIAAPLCARCYKGSSRETRPPLSPTSMPGTYIPVTNTEPWTEAEDERLRKAYKRYQHA